MTVRDSHVQATTQVLAHVARAKDSLHHIHGDNLNAYGVFIHPSRQLVSLKVAREELDKAISLMERTRWTR